MSIKQAFANFLNRFQSSAEDSVVELFDDGNWRLNHADPTGFCVLIPAGCRPEEAQEIFDLHWMSNQNVQAAIASQEP